MAITQVVVASPAVETIYSNTALGNAVSGVKASSTLLFYAIFDNSLNAAATYVKIFNLASGSVTLGTTAPDEIIYIPGLQVLTHLFYTSAAPGKTYGTALSIAAVTTGGTAGTSAPSSNFTATLSYV